MLLCLAGTWFTFLLRMSSLFPARWRLQVDRDKVWRLLSYTTHLRLHHLLKAVKPQGVRVGKDART